MGLGVADIRTQRVSLQRAGLWGEDVQAVAFVGNDLWIGGMNDGAHEGITRWMGRRKWQGFETPYINGLNSTMVHDFTAGNNEMWVATQQGLSRYDLKRDYWNTLSVFKGLWSEAVLSTAPFMGDIYVGTDRGLNRVSQGVVFREENWFRNLGVLQFASDGDTLWAANAAGMYRKVDGNQWEELGGVRGTVGPQTTDIAVTPEVVWFARRDGVEGLVRRTGQWKSLLATHYFDSLEPTTVAADAINLWVGTGKGIYQFNIEKETVVHQYQPKDGLLYASVQILRIEGNYLWIGTHRGLCRFYWNKPNRGY
jgi:ligand-binding sensor domain-containing protein